MAVQGPVMPSDEIIDEAVSKIMTILRNGYGVSDPVIHQPFFIIDKDTGERLPSSGSWITMSPSDEHWHMTKKALRRSVAEMLYAQACSDW